MEQKAPFLIYEEQVQNFHDAIGVLDAAIDNNTDVAVYSAIEDSRGKMLEALKIILKLLDDYKPEEITEELCKELIDQLKEQIKHLEKSCENLTEQNRLKRFDDKSIKQLEEIQKFMTRNQRGWETAMSPNATNPCDPVGIRNALKEMREKQVVLSNLLEDNLGNVRVYLRIRKFVSTIEDPSKIQYALPSNDPNTIETAGKVYQFFGIFGEDDTTQTVFVGKMKDSSRKVGDLFSDMVSLKNTKDKHLLDSDVRGFFNLFQQIKDGYHLVLMGYGTSGSGKTYTLGLSVDDDKKNIPGLLQYGLVNLIESNALEPETCVVEIFEVFEQYVNTLEFRPLLSSRAIYNRPEQIIFDGKIIMLYNEEIKAHNIERDNKLEAENKLIIGNNLSTENKDIILVPPQIIIDDGFQLTNFEEFTNFFENLTTYRTKMNRIVETQNNKSSSRSNLYIVLKVVTKKGSNETTGYLTIVDSGGMEDPRSIFDKMYYDTDRKKDVRLDDDTLEKFIVRDYILNTELDIYNNEAGVQTLDKEKLTTFLKNTATKIKSGIPLYRFLADLFMLKTLGKNKDGTSIFLKWEQYEAIKVLANIRRNGRNNLIKIRKGGAIVHTDRQIVQEIVDKLEKHKKNMTILKEGFFINEHLNHLKQFFINELKAKNTINKQIYIDKISIDTIDKEYKPYKPSHIFRVPPANITLTEKWHESFSGPDPDPIKTITIFTRLKSLSSEKTKFIMMGTIRPGTVYEDDTQSTLTFLNEISSTAIKMDRS